MRSNLIDNKALSSFQKKNNVVAWADISTRLVFHIACVTVIWYSFAHDYLIVGSVVMILHIMSYAFLGLAGISHELFHNTVFRAQKTNQFFYILFSILTWNNFNFFRITHWKHHLVTLSPEDPKDIFKGQLTTWSIIQYLTFDFGSFYRRIKITFMNSKNTIPGKLGATLFKEGSKERKDVVTAARIILAFHVLSILLFCYFELYLLIFLVNLAPFFVTFPNKILAISQHYGLGSNDEKNYFASSRTVVLNPVLAFLYANMNYHVEHHFFSGVPHYNLSKLHNELMKNHSYENLSFGFWGLIRDMKKLGLFKT